MGGGGGSGAGGGAGGGGKGSRAESWSSFHERHHSTNLCGIPMCAGYEQDDTFISGMVGKLASFMSCSDDEGSSRSLGYPGQGSVSSSKKVRLSLSRRKSKKRGNMKISSFQR
eukprot:CAMPEP_0113555964 /NCGR_PEP_ID=MMETSP0015_2-20120614/17003_1 /TAXON_ID=2838 /ORGANISM="Odontella" /LENGTH=112 /DNA_ID=CAMNT_0000457287 /DNA_START=265 /DNA_END=603 /DNA_ORIENTATION=+ /assembly_acc=CAM_ASM_000160